MGVDGDVGFFSDELVGYRVVDVVAGIGDDGFVVGEFEIYVASLVDVCMD